MTDGPDPTEDAAGAESPRRGPRVIDVLLMALLPLFLFLIDLEATHRAGHPRHRLARLRAYLARGVRPRH